MILFCVSHKLHSVLESGQEVWIVENDFSAAFDIFSIKEFSIFTALWVLEVLCCLY